MRLGQINAQLGGAIGTGVQLQPQLLDEWDVDRKRDRGRALAHAGIIAEASVSRR